MNASTSIRGEGLTDAELRAISKMESDKRDLILAQRAKLEAIWAARRAEFQPLKDKFREFGITFDDPYDLLSSPPNTYVLLIPDIVECLDLFKDSVNQDIVLRLLNRPEANGLVGDKIIRFYKNCTTSNEKWLANRAIATTAQSSDLSKLKKLFLDDGNRNSRDAFVDALVKFMGKGAIPLLVVGLEMEDEVVLASIKALRKLKSKEAKEVATAKIQSKDSKLRRVSQSYLKAIQKFH